MGRIVVTEFVSLDGVMEDPGGSESFTHGGWTFEIDRGEGNTFKLEETMATDALLLGRVTYDGFADAWPSRDGEFAEKFNSMPKYVVSSTLENPEWNNTSVLEGDLGEGVATLKARYDGDVVVHGSAQLVQALLEGDLVDELPVDGVPRGARGRQAPLRRHDGQEAPPARRHASGRRRRAHPHVRAAGRVARRRRPGKEDTTVTDIEPQTAAGKVLLHFLISLDGFVAGPGHSMDWMAGTTNRPGLVQEYVETTGAVLAGRDGFDSAIGDARPYGGKWEGPIFVLTHHPEDARPAEGVTFLDCPVEEAVRIGLEAAGGKNLEVFSPTIGKQLLQLGLIDEIDLHLAPVLLGDGIRLYDAPGGRPVHLARAGSDPTLTVSVRYRPIDDPSR